MVSCETLRLIKGVLMLRTLFCYHSVFYYNDNQIVAFSCDQGSWLREGNTEEDSVLRWEIQDYLDMTKIDSWHFNRNLLQWLIEVQSRDPKNCCILEDLLEYMGYF